MAPLGSLQLRIMAHIWAKGPRTVHEDHDAFHADPTTKRLAYTTYLTVLRNLTKRGFLEQIKGDRAHVFAPLIDERTFKLSQVCQVRQVLFDGNANSLLRYLAQDDEIETGKREQIAAIINV
jgi:predicted transcriptional regulator